MEQSGASNLSNLLSNLIALRRSISSFKKRADELKDAAESLQGIAPAEKVQKSPGQPAWTAMAEAAADLEKEAERLSVELQAEESKARVLISRLDNPTSRQILTEVFIRGRSIANTALVMGYSVQHAYRLYHSAMHDIEDLMADEDPMLIE